MFYLLIWVVTLFVSTYMFKVVSGSLSLTKPNMISITYYYSLLISSFIGSILIVLNIDGSYMLYRLHNSEYRVIGFYWICYIMIAMPSTMLLISKWTGFRANKELSSYLEAPVEFLKGEKKSFYLIFSVLTAISLLAVVYTFIKLDQVPLFELFRGSDALKELRIDASRGFAGNVLFRNIFAIGLTPLLSFIAYIYLVKTKEIKWLVLFLPLFTSSIIISIYDLQKAPIFFYVLMFILVNIFIGKFRLTYKKIVALGIAGVALLVVLYVFVQGVNSADQFLSYNSGPIGRLILSQISPFYFHLDLFGDEVDFLYGKSLPNLLLGLYDIEQVRSANLVMATYYPDRVEQGIAGVLNTLFAGEAYANFGYLGILFGTIYVGLFIQIFYIGFLRLPKHPILISLFVFFSVNFPRVVVGGFSDFIFNVFWTFILVLFSGILLLIRLKSDVFQRFFSSKNV